MAETASPSSLTHSSPGPSELHNTMPGHASSRSSLFRYTRTLQRGHPRVSRTARSPPHVIQETRLCATKPEDLAVAGVWKLHLQNLTTRKTKDCSHVAMDLMRCHWARCSMQGTQAKAHAEKSSPEGCSCRCGVDAYHRSQSLCSDSFNAHGAPWPVGCSCPKT